MMTHFSYAHHTCIISETNFLSSTQVPKLRHLLGSRVHTLISETIPYMHAFIFHHAPSPSVYAGKNNPGAGVSVLYVCVYVRMYVYLDELSFVCLPVCLVGTDSSFTIQFWDPCFQVHVRYRCQSGGRWTRIYICLPLLTVLASISNLEIIFYCC